MTDHTLKFGRKDSFTKFFQEIDDAVKQFKDELDPDQPPPSFITFWTSVKHKGILGCNTRATINRTLLGRTTLGKEKNHQTMSKIIKCLREKMDFLDDRYHFTQLEDDKEVVIVTLKAAQTSVQTATATTTSEWITPAPNRAFKQTNMLTYAEATKPSAKPQSINSFELLQSTDDSPSNLADKNDDDDLSYDPSTHASPDSSTPALKDPPAIAPEPVDQTPVTQNLMITNGDNNETSLDDVESFNFDVSNDDGNQDNVNLSDSDPHSLTAKERMLIFDALENRTIHKLDNNLLARWINDTASDIHTSSTLLNTHRNKVEIFLDEKEAKLKQQMEQHAERISIDRNKLFIEKIKKHYVNTRKDLLETGEIERLKITRENESTKQWVTEATQKLNSIKKEIFTAEHESIMTVNSCGNQHLTDIRDEIKKGEQLQRDLAENIISANASKREVVHAITHLRNEVEQLYQKFGDDITSLADDERENFRSWINQRQHMLDEHRELCEEIKKERDIVAAERRLLRTERELMATQRVEFQQWADGIKSQFNATSTKQFTSSMPPSSPRRPAPTRRPRTPPGPMFSDDDPVHYVNQKYDVYGYIMSTVAPNYENGVWHYAIYTAAGNKIYDCEEHSITLVHDTVPPNYRAPPTPVVEPPVPKSPLHPSRRVDEMPEQHHYHRHSNVPEFPAFEPRPWHRPNRSPRQRPPSDNEFCYPIGTEPKQVYALQLNKAAKNWNLTIQNEHDLRGFYERLKGQVEHFNILLRNYEDITVHDTVATITASNCTNYEMAVRHMSKTLFNLFDNYKATIFQNYLEPLGYFESFRPQLDGLGFLKMIMKKRHPDLREVEFGIEDKVLAPTMKESNSIFTFINHYIEWLHDEELRNHRQYTALEQILYVLDQLDENLYQQAKSVIREEIQKLNLNSRSPKEIPSHLLVDNQLGLYILGLLPSTTRASIYDDIARQVQLDTAATSAQVRRLYDNSSLDSSPQINKTQTDRKRTSSSYYKKREANNNSDSWVDELKWEVLPNETCPACFKSNHNVYKTGCPTFATFAVCNEFYKTCDKSNLEKVKRAYKQYQKELSIKKRKRRNEDRRTIKTLANDDSLAANLPSIKKTFFNKYLDDFRDEQYCLENPYDDLDSEDDEEHFDE